MAQSPEPRAESRLSVYLVTIGEGPAIWEKFGHNALWFVDSAAGVDEAYNWGVFDFRSPGFAWRFVTGDTRYWVEAYQGTALVEAYVRRDRSVDVQRLNLTEAQAQRALSFVRANALEANKYYRYDYFRDNCSTRVRDVIDLATEGALRRATAADTVRRSYKSESVRLMDDLKLAQLGIDIALGRPADRAITIWDGMFIPMRLRDALRDVQVTGASGTIGPLVVSERAVHASSLHAERRDMPLRWPFYLFIGLAVAADIAVIGVLAERHRALSVAFSVEATLWSLATGVLGAGVLFAWVATRHDFWAANENLLLVNPLSVWLGVLVPLAQRNVRWLRPAAIVAALVALCAALALILDGVPGAGQQNLALIGLLLPPHFAVAFVLWRRAVQRDAERGTRDA